MKSSDALLRDPGFAKSTTGSVQRCLHRTAARWLTTAAFVGLAFLAFLTLSLAALAQSAGTGKITGRVLNPATNEYIRNAEVRIQGTNLVASSEDGGYYRLHNVPAGAVTVVATYTGAESATATVNVSPGAIATRDFELAAAGSRRTGDDIVKLGAFVNARYALTKNLSIFVSGDRAYDSGKIWFYKSDGRIRQVELYGSQWSIGLRGDY